MPIEKDIHDLLYAHDCVIVPHFGGFLTHYRTARLDESRQLVHPPSKDVSFNQQLIRNDGLLADRVAKRAGVPFDEAVRRIGAEVDSWQSRLGREGRLELARLGTFFTDHEANLQFEPDRRVNYLRESYGLRPVAAVPVQRRSMSLPPVAPSANIPMEEASKEDRRRMWLPAAAILSGVVFMAALWALMPLTNKEASWSGLLPLVPAAEGRFTPRTEFPALIEEEEEGPWTAPDGHGVRELAITGEPERLVAVDLGPALSVEAVPDSTHVAVAKVVFRYHVVGGCFSVSENAARFVDGLKAKGFAAHQIDLHRGLHRVAYGSYPDRVMALEALAAIRKSEAPEAWLLVK
ncbi:MAG: SPOR domain-containing protein [Flavobacteriales bacterium]|nr:SPOR domain-containing protein [Flavobacteriales bacterium]